MSSGVLEIAFVVCVATVANRRQATDIISDTLMIALEQSQERSQAVAADDVHGLANNNHNEMNEETKYVILNNCCWLDYYYYYFKLCTNYDCASSLCDCNDD